MRPPLSDRPILFVTHEASRTGAPMFLLHFLRWLARETAQRFEILVRRDGPLAPEFARLGPVRTPAEFDAEPRRFERYALVYANTACNGLYLEGFDLSAVPVLTHVHELDFGLDTLGPRNFAAIVRHTDHFIACAEVVAAQLRRRFRIAPEHITVRHEMFDPAVVDANAAAPEPAALAERGIAPDAPLVAGCGTVDLRKGVDLFVQLAAAVLRRWESGTPPHFVWIGRETEPVFAGLLEHDIRRAGLEGRVHLVGEQPNPHAWLKRAAVFCLTSREDPFPLVMLEASALGRPLVAFAGAGGAGELCALGAGAAVPFLDVDAMAERCGLWLRDASAREQAGRDAAALVRGRFVPDAMAPVLWDDLRVFARAGRAAKHGTTAEIYRGWNQDALPEPAYVRRVLAQAEAWAAVRRLAAAGRRSEAGMGVVRIVQAAKDTQDGRWMVETLLQAAQELAAFDAPRAEVLLRQAEQMLRPVPATSEWTLALKRDLERALRAWAQRGGAGRRVA